jgi:hypothetical protein
MYLGIHVEYPLFLRDFNETLNFPTNFLKYSYIKFHENLSAGSRVIPSIHPDGRTDVTKLTTLVTICAQKRSSGNRTWGYGLDRAGSG